MSFEKSEKTNFDKMMIILNNTNFIDVDYYYYIYINLLDNYNDKYDITNFIDFITKKDFTEETLKDMMFNQQIFRSLEYIKIFIKNGFNVDSQNKDGKTLLNLACKMENIEYVKYLLEDCHADQLIYDNKNRLPLHRCLHKN